MLTRPRLLALLLNLVVLTAFAVAVEHWWGWHKLLAPWASLPKSTLALCVSGMLISYFFRALRIYLEAHDIPRDALFACLRLILINNAMKLLLPAGTGEATFPILMQRWFGINPARATGTVMWLRLLDLHVLTTIVAACVAGGWVHIGSSASPEFIALGWIGVGILGTAPLVAFLTRSILLRWLARRPGRVPLLLGRALAALPTRPAWLLLDLALSWAAWLSKLLALGWVLSQLAGIDYVLGVLGTIGGDMVTSLPIHAPGGFGTYEAGVMAVLVPVTGSSGPLLAAVVNVHLLLLTTALLAGAAAWLFGHRHPAVAAGSDARL